MIFKKYLLAIAFGFVVTIGHSSLSWGAADGELSPYSWGHWSKIAMPASGLPAVKAPVVTAPAVPTPEVAPTYTISPGKVKGQVQRRK